MSDDTAIRLSGVDFSYEEGRAVFCGLDLAVKHGERVALIGPNGCGKTTLLWLVTGLLMPDAGTIEVFGAQRRAEKDFIEVRRRAGLLFQDPDEQLFCPTVEEDVAFGPLNLGKSRDEVRNIVADALHAVGLEGYEERVTYKLSTGEKHLVALAGVLAMGAEVLLLDEPTAGLDPHARSHFIDLVAGLDAGMVMATHDFAMAGELADRVLVIAEGEVAADGPVAEILSDRDLLGKYYLDTSHQVTAEGKPAKTG